MSTLEKFFVGLTWVLLGLGAFLVRRDPNEVLLFLLPLSVLSFLILNWVKRRRTFKRALAKGVIRIERNSSSATQVRRELPFPITKDDYASLQGAIGRLSDWMDDPTNQGKYPVVFYFRGHFRFLASKYEFDNLVDELQAKYRELS